MKSLVKTLGILQLFQDTRHELTLGEISAATHVNKTTVSRIVSTLVKYDYLRQKGKRGAYYLGTVYLNFSGIVKNNIQIREVVASRSLQLGKKLQETILIAYGNGKDSVFTESFHDDSMPKNILKVIPGEGSGMPLHNTSTGKILLANMSKEDLQNYFDKAHLKPFTSNTITSINDMKNHLILIRREGVAFDDEEYAPGVRGVAAVIKDSSRKVVGAIAVVAPSVRLTRNKMREIAPDVKNCAESISKDLGLLE